MPGRPIQYGTTDIFLEFLGVKNLDDLPASDVLNSQQIDDWMQRNSNSRELTGDQDVGLTDDSDQGTLEFAELTVNSSWRRENIESDAASNFEA